jgi:5-hydroxyisourate hydrolase-like protein (transthyretin family)
MTRLVIAVVLLLVLAPIAGTTAVLADGHGAGNGAVTDGGPGGPSEAALENAEADLVTVTIKVRTPDGDPIGGADVTVEYEQGSNQTQTFSNGNALVDVPREADLRISVTHSDYVLNFPKRVASVRDEEEVDIVMRRASLVIANVEDENGPVEGAEVTMWRPGSSRDVAQGTTDADGRFRSPELEQGEYVVRVRKDGYYEETKRVDATGRIETTVEIEEGSVPVSVTVRDDYFDSPQAVSDATVTVLYRGGQIIQAQTGSSGSREISLGVNAQYTLRVTKDGYRTDEETIVLGESAKSTSFNIQREPSLSVETLTTRVVAGEAVLVRVRNAYGEAVEGATVSRNGTVVGETDGNGELQVDVPEQGTYDITAEADGVSDDVLVEGIAPSEATTTTTTTTETTTTTTTETTTTEAPLPGFTALVAGVAVLAGIAVLAVRRRF